MRKEKPQIGVVYNTFFVHYDQEGNVHLLSNIKNEQYGKALKIAIKISDYTIRNDREVGVFKKLTS